MAPKSNAIRLCPGAYEQLCDEAGNWSTIGNEARKLMRTERLAELYGAMLGDTLQWVARLHARLELCAHPCDRCPNGRALSARSGLTETAVEAKAGAAEG